MRPTRIVLLIAVALSAPSGLAQTRAETARSVDVQAGTQATAASDTETAATRNPTGDPPSAENEPARPRSAFGRVMSVMIAALVQDSTRRQQAAAQSATSIREGAGTTLPIDIELQGAYATDAAVPARRRETARPQAAMNRAGTVTATTATPLATQTAGL